MSVTIVSAMPKGVAAAPADSRAAASNADNGAPALDFARLLSGQLAPAALPPFAATASAQDPTEGDASTASEDAAALFAALGIVAAPLPPTLATAAATPPADATAAAAPDALAGLAEAGASAAATRTTTPATAAAATAANHLAAATTPAATAVPAAAETAATARAEPAIIAAATPKAVPEAAENSQNAAAAASAAAAANAAAAAAAPQRPTTTALPTAFRDSQWGGDFAQKVVWLATSDKQLAQLTLNPPQMGPIEISMSVDKGSASATFFSANAEVREAIETALPRLREMLAGAGIELGQANVSAESFKQAQANEYGTPGGSRSRSDNAILVADSNASPRGRAEGAARGSGLVDLFA